MKVQETINQAGWFERLKEHFTLANMTEKFNEYKDIIIEVALYSGVGFLTGFLLKKYASYVAVFVLFIVSIIVLYQFDIVVFVINWTKVYEILGIQPETITDDSILTIAWEFMKNNVVVTVSFIVGFLVGFKFA